TTPTASVPPWITRRSWRAAMIDPSLPAPLLALAKRVLATLGAPPDASLYKRIPRSPLAPATDRRGSCRSRPPEFSWRADPHAGRDPPRLSTRGPRRRRGAAASQSGRSRPQGRRQARAGDPAPVAHSAALARADRNVAVHPPR